MSERPIHYKQISALRTAASKAFKGNNDDYYAWLSDTYRVNSTKSLNFVQASEAITLLRKLCDYKDELRRYSGSGKKGRAGSHLTQAQANKIDTLEILLGWHDDRARLLAFIKRQTGQNSAVQMLLNYQASKVIIGMQRILADGNKDVYKFLNTMDAARVDTPMGQALLAAIQKRIEVLKDEK